MTVAVAVAVLATVMRMFVAMPVSVAVLTVAMAVMVSVLVATMVVVPAAIMMVVVVIGRPPPEGDPGAVIVAIRDTAAVIEKPSRAAIPVGLSGRCGAGHHAESSEQRNGKEE